MRPTGKAVFLSYASQDADAAMRLREGLRAEGVEVWFDQSELRGGDAWDASIRARIKDCALFVPVISRNTEARGEGYFRLEWKLAVERSRLMADDLPFLLPVAIDDTAEETARVPDAFLERQWTRIPQGRDASAFAARVRDLLAVSGGLAASRAATQRPPAKSPSRAPLGLGLGIAAMAMVALIVARRDAPPLDRASAPLAVETAVPPAAAPPQSVAVMPFANLSNDKSNEYFSDGVAEELLTLLQKIPGLQVAARSSSFAFKAAGVSPQEVGQKLGVAHLVEGSVRKSGNTVRIAARLVRARNGEQLWSDAYTRDLADVFAVQGELAQSIVEQLRGKLGPTSGSAASALVRAQVEAAAKGGTRNAQAHQLYLQGLFNLHQVSKETVGRAIEFLERAVALDPSFASAWAALSFAGAYRGAHAENPREYRDGFTLARRAADNALRTEPHLSSAWLARARVQLLVDFDWRGAAESVRRANALAPGDADSMLESSRVAFAYGRREQALEFAEQAAARDPLNVGIRTVLAFALESLGRYSEAQSQFERVTELSPRSPYAHAGVALMLMRQGRLEEAAREVDKAPIEWERVTVRSQIEWARGHKARADADLEKLRETLGDVAAFQVAQVYAHRKDANRAFQWLERSLEQRDPGLTLVKIDPTFATLTGDPRWPAFLGKLGLLDHQLN